MLPPRLSGRLRTRTGRGGHAAARMPRSRRESQRPPCVSDGTIRQWIPRPLPTRPARLPSFQQLRHAQHVPPPDSGIGLPAHPDRSSCDGPCCMPPSPAVRRAHSPQPIGLITRRDSFRGGLGLSSSTAFVACCVDSGVLLPFGKNSHLSNFSTSSAAVTPLSGCGATTCS